MDGPGFDTWTRRRFGAAVGVAALVGLGGLDSAGAKKKRRKRKSRGNLCTRDGQTCAREGNGCRREFCLAGPFTITAAWTATGDHDTYLFLPQNARVGPSPYIDWECSVDLALCDIGYPFACIEGGSDETGDEVTTIFQLLKGTYEYWLELVGTTAAGEVVVTVRDRGGRVVRQWENPANALANDVSWHVFNIDGGPGTVASVDEVLNELLPKAAGLPITYVCPIIF